MNRKLHDSLGAEFVLAPATVSSDTASNWLDLTGFGACEFVVYIGTITGAGSITPKIQYGSTTADTGAAAAAAADVVGDFTAVTTANDVATFRACYCGDARYARVLLDVTDTASATCTVVALAGQANSEPADDPTTAAAT